MFMNNGAVARTTETKMITRIERLQNGFFRVETVGVGMARVFKTMAEARKDAEIANLIFRGGIVVL